MEIHITREALVLRVPTRDPGDVASLEALFDSGAIAPEEVVAIFGKTEGNGCVNDFTGAVSLMRTSLRNRRRSSSHAASWRHSAKADERFCLKVSRLLRCQSRLK
jgi:hypothetical protein